MSEERTRARIGFIEKELEQICFIIKNSESTFELDMAAKEFIKYSGEYQLLTGKEYNQTKGGQE